MRKSILSNLPYNNSSNCPKLLYHTKFKGVSLDTGHYESTQKDWHQDFTDSIDSVTGVDLINDAKTLWGSSTEVDVLSIPQANVATVGEFETYFLNTITSEGLSLSIPSSHGDYPTYTGVPQTTFNIRRSAAQAAADDMGAICFSGRFKLPATLDLTGNNSAGQYCTIFEAKSGGYGGVGGVGDFRIQLMINRGAHGYNEWQCKIDNSANGIGVIPGFDSLINYSLGYSGITAQLDVWTRYYIWWDRAVGRLTASIKVDGQESQIISDVYPADLIAGGLSSGTLYGLHDLPFTRIAACFMYATGGYPTTMVWEDLQVWDSIPQLLGYIEMGNHGPLPWVPTPLSKATMFGASDGNDDNPGTEASPKTYQGAINAAVNPGDVVFFRDGTLALTTAAHFSLWNVGTAAQPIIYEVYPGEVFTIDGAGITPGVGNQRRVNYSDSFQKLRGVRIINMPEYGIYNSGLDNMVDGCEIAYCNLSGVSNTGSRLTVINSWIHHCSDVGKFGGNYNNGGNADGISFSSGTGGKILHNLITDCSDDLIDTWQSLHTTVKYNICLRAGLGDGNGNAIKGGGGGVGAYAIIDHNLVAFCTGNGVDANTGIGVTMRHNTSAYNGGVGFVLEADTVHSGNVSIGDGSTHSGTGITGLRNSWEIAGTPVFLNIDPDSPDFLKVTQGDGFDGIGAHYI